MGHSEPTQAAKCESVGVSYPRVSPAIVGLTREGAGHHSCLPCSPTPPPFGGVFRKTMPICVPRAVLELDFGVGWICGYWYPLVPSPDSLSCLFIWKMGHPPHTTVLPLMAVAAADQERQGTPSHSPTTYSHPAGTLSPAAPAAPFRLGIELNQRI